LFLFFLQANRILPVVQRLEDMRLLSKLFARMHRHDTVLLPQLQPAGKTCREAITQGGM
jgi:hypothetical protein